VEDEEVLSTQRGKQERQGAREGSTSEQPREDGFSVNSQQRRSILLRALITTAHLAQAQIPPEGEDLEVIERSWEYAIGHIPTHHLEECFRRALQAKTDTYPLSAPEVNAVWQDYSQELVRIGVNNELKLLIAAADGSGKEPMTFSEWKWQHSPANERHDERACAVCLQRVQAGQPPIHTLAAFGHLIGTVQRFEAEQEAGAARERLRAEPLSE
jgi:hypothetical protein